MKYFNNNKEDKAYKKLKEDKKLFYKTINGVDGYSFIFQEELPEEEKKRAGKPNKKRWWSRKK